MHRNPNVRTHRRNVVYLWALARIYPGNLVSGAEFSGTSRQSSLKHVKPTSPCKMGTNGIPNRGTTHRSTLTPYVHASQIPWETTLIQTLPSVSTSDFNFHLCVTLPETYQWQRSLCGSRMLGFSNFRVTLAF